MNVIIIIGNDNVVKRGNEGSVIVVIYVDYFIVVDMGFKV